MKRFLAVIVMAGLILSIPLISMGEDSKEVLILKRDLAQEKVLRIQTQLSLMQQQFAEGQKYLKEVQNELNDLNAKVESLEVKKEQSPKPTEKKK